MGEVEQDLRRELQEEKDEEAAAAAQAEAMQTQRMAADPKDTLEQLVGMIDVASEFRSEAGTEPSASTTAEAQLGARLLRSGGPGGSCDLSCTSNSRSEKEE